MTTAQREALQALTSGPLTARQLAQAGEYRTVDKARKRLRSLENNGLVRRTYVGQTNTAHWELTRAGRAALQLTG